MKTSNIFKDFRVLVDENTGELTIQKVVVQVVAQMKVPMSVLSELLGSQEIHPFTGPTLEEWAAAGYKPSAYPPHGYEAKPFNQAVMDKLEEEWIKKDEIREQERQAWRLSQEHSELERSKES